MTNNIKLIYDHIQKDLKAQGWNDEAIAEAIAEAKKERQATGADDKTICIKEVSYLSQESLLKIVLLINKEKTNTNIFVRLKNRIINLVKNFWSLNWDVKIGILFVIPAIIGILNGEYYYEDTPTILIYHGLMAIAGAYLIKGNLKNKD